MALESGVSRAYRTATPSDQTKLGDDIILGIGTTGVTTFGALATEIAAFIPINKEYKILCTDAEGGDINKINTRNDYERDKWLPPADLLADGVEGIALGRKTIVDLSGFKSTATERVSRDIPNQMILDAQGGVSGSNTINHSTKTKMDAEAFLTLALKTGDGTITQNGNQFLVSIPDSDGKTIHKVYMEVSTTKDGQMTGLVRKDELDLQTVGFNAAGCSVISNKANVVVP